MPDGSHLMKRLGHEVEVGQEIYIDLEQYLEARLSPLPAEAIPDDQLKLADIDLRLAHELIEKAIQRARLWFRKDHRTIQHLLDANERIENMRDSLKFDCDDLKKGKYLF